MKNYFIAFIFTGIISSCNQTNKKVETEDVVKIISSMNANSNNYTMKKTEQEIHHFFSAYEKMNNDALTSGNADVNKTAELFSECFVESSPVGVICGTNGKEFHEKIIQGNAFYRSIGTQSMKILNKEITLLDNYHAMVKVHWQAMVTRKDHTEARIEFDVIYMLQMLNSKIKIFAYIAEDEQKSYKENNIEPYK